MAGRAAQRSLRARTLTDGSCAFELPVNAIGKRESVMLHERADCDCGCGGGWDERGARRELSNVLASVLVERRPAGRSLEAQSSVDSRPRDLRRFRSAGHPASGVPASRRRAV